jgi:hypothetical protein
MTIGYDAITKTDKQASINMVTTSVSAQLRILTL